MQIDYWIEFGCEPKRKLGVDGLRARLHDLERLGAGQGVTEEEATRALEAGFALRPMAFHCGRCPANYQRREFGCIGFVPLPLSGAGEEWLIELLPQTLKPAVETPDERRRLGAIRDLLRRVRERAASPALDAYAERAFTAPAPAVRRYGFLRPERITSRQILDLLLFRGDTGPRMAETTLRALGVWKDGATGIDGVREAVFTQPVEGRDDPSVAALKRVFLALIVACSLDVGACSSIVE